MNDTLQWLLGSEPYVEYRARLDLLKQSFDDPDVKRARAAMLKQPLVKDLLAELGDWPGDVINNHKKAGLPIHKLALLAEIGITRDDPGTGVILDKIMAHLSGQGVPEALVNIPKAFGGSGDDQWAWMLCDAPRLCFSLLKMGVDEAALNNGIRTLTAFARENGFPCAAAPQLGRFRGPGKRGDPCPYATLLMLSALLETGQDDCPAMRAGAECLLALWEHSRERYPYLFHMGTDFRKLKAPFVWYDILHVADVLSQISWLRCDPRLLDILRTIRSKADGNGSYTPESIWTAWKAWDFGQKKQPSPWITFLVYRILNRMDGV